MVTVVVVETTLFPIDPPEPPRRFVRRLLLDEAFALWTLALFPSASLSLLIVPPPTCPPSAPSCPRSPATTSIESPDSVEITVQWGELRNKERESVSDESHKLPALARIEFRAPTPSLESLTRHLRLVSASPSLASPRRFCPRRERDDTGVVRAREDADLVVPREPLFSMETADSCSDSSRTGAR
nr:MAG: hypothetical protein [Apis mellifera filamentous virus]